MRSSGWLIGFLLVVVTAGLGYVLMTRGEQRVQKRLEGFLSTFKPTPDPSIWPGPDAVLHSPTITFPEHFPLYKVFIDPGHGAKGNSGNLSSFCNDEQDYTLALAEDLAAHLGSTDRFEVELSRRGDQLVPYPERVKRASAWGAHVFLSLHSDVRGRMETWSPDAGLECPRSEEAPGFSVLWSDEGPLSPKRQSLARIFANHIRDSGFLAYDGEEYELYEGDEACPGVFVDRHLPGKRIFVLRAPTMPSLIVETHNAWDPREAMRWETVETREVFFDVVIASLVEFFGAPK